MAMAEMLESNASSPPSRNSSTSSSGLDHRNFPDQNHVNVHTASTSGTRFGSSSDINWQNLSQVEVRISGLPSTSSTWDVYRMVEQYGNVIRISMVGDSNSGQRSKSRQARKTAYVKFQPPPTTAFWENGQALKFGYACLSDHNKPMSVPDPAKKGALLPAHLAQVGASIEFGFMLEQSRMMSMYSTGQQDLEMAINLSNKTRKCIDVNFDVHVQGRHDPAILGRYRLQLKIESLRTIYIEASDDYDILVIPTDAPAELHCKAPNIADTHDKSSNTWSDWDAMVRQTDVVKDKALLRSSPTSIRRDSAIIDIGRWTTYRLLFRRTSDSASNLKNMMQVLERHNVHVRRQHIEVALPETSKMWDLIDSDLSRPNEALGFSNLLLLQQEAYPLSFATRYQLEVCISHGYLHENNVTSDFLRQLHGFDQSQSGLAVGFLERVATLKKRHFDPMDIFGLQVSSLEVTATKTPPVHCTIARSATITPTMVYFNTPGIEISNRVIRLWSEHSDRFLRVRFSEELTYGRIMSNSGGRNNELYDRVRQVLQNGILLGNRKYEFLAFGSSQFREHGAYFFAPTKKLTCEYIRSQLGQLDEMDRRLPAKFCARIGQNFSTTRGLSVQVKITVYKENTSILVLPDVVRNGFTFTDGVGKISSFLARMIAAEFKLPTEDAPAVFQFRLGGCKGVLAMDPTLGSHEVHIRRSQYKFAAIHHGLEIIRTSSYASASLNRQIIMVLSALGVSDSVFLSKMRSQLRALELAMNDESVALHELQKIVDGNQVTLMMANMIQNGFMAAKEPFVVSMLKLWRSWTLKYLKEKAKISIENGAFLLGTVDETATLRGHFYHNRPQPGDTWEDRVAKLPEVFCRVDRNRKGVYETITGVCILARNPSLHPGDIRVVHAIDVPRLHHLTNTIVFPQTGDRDVSNMCSGGDLDGDDYLLIWDQNLIPEEWNHPPMDFTPAKPQYLDREVNVRDMTDFFVDYMKSDRLALIATNHLAYADRDPIGVKSRKCLELAQLHSFAVDYPKSGQAVEIPQHLRKPGWPHFMEKRRTVPSLKILGQLYDLVVKEDFAPEYSSPFDRRILSAYTHSQEVLSKVETIKHQYDSRMRKIMAQHGIATEFEVWSAFVMKHNNEKKDYSFSEELGTLMEAVRTSFRQECEIMTGGRDADKLHPFVAAMYTVTALQVLKAKQDDDDGNGSLEKPLISFPWLFMQDLCKIATGGTQAGDSAHRVQGVQKRHHINHGTLEDEGAGQIETKEGIVAMGEVFDPFSEGQQEASASHITFPEDDHSAMIEKSIGGTRPDRDETRRDVVIRALREHHDDENSAAAAAPKHEIETNMSLEPNANFVHVQDGNMKDAVKVELDIDDSDDD